MLLPLMLVLAVAAPRPAVGDSIVVSFVPSATTVQAGETFTVDIVANIPASMALVSWGMDASFDSSILGHDPLADVAIGSAFTPAQGLVGDGDGLLAVALAPDPPVSGTSVVLATLTFTALQVGMTDLVGELPEGAPFAGFFALGGTAIPVTFEGAVVAVVPLPPAVLLGGLGLACAGIMRRRVMKRR
jgi:hypothetical protein